MEKILVIPIPPENTEYPSNVQRSNTTIITVWKNNELCGYVSWNGGEDEWFLYLGTEYEDSSEELSNIMKRHTDLTFKVSIL